MSDIEKVFKDAHLENETPEKSADFEAQLQTLIEKAPGVAQAAGVHFVDAYGLKMCSLKRVTRYNGTAKSKQSSTNNVRHVTCRLCLHTIINRATARMDELAQEARNAKAS